jgi:hypothetical protein
MTTRIPALLTLALSCGLAACGAPADPGLVADAEDELRAECQPWGCGSNAATLGFGIRFHEIDPDGAPNAAGIRMLRAAMGDGRAVRVRVLGDELTAVALDNPSVSYRDTHVVGLTMTLAHVPTGRLFELRVAEAHTSNDPILHFWAGDPDFVRAYVFTFQPLGSKQSFDVCQATALDPPWSPTTGMTRHAVVFQGDRYDARSKAVFDGSRQNWFNLACAGTATAKMHVLRHTTAGARMSSGLTYATTWAQRQAMLRMFVADYCSTGDSYTEDGHPLAYMDPRGFPTNWLPLDLSPASGQKLEAIWGPNGAVCLDEPRLDTVYARSDVSCAASRPRCPDVVWHDDVGWRSDFGYLGYVASANVPR